MPNVKIEFDITKWTWGDIEDIDDWNDHRAMRQVIERHAKVTGIKPDELTAHLRALTIDEFLEIRNQLLKAVRNRSNPENGTGKN